jgi:hypothetical protein
MIHARTPNRIKGSLLFTPFSGVIWDAFHVLAIEDVSPSFPHGQQTDRAGQYIDDLTHKPAKKQSFLDLSNNGTCNQGLIIIFIES